MCVGIGTEEHRAKIKKVCQQENWTEQMKAIGGDLTSYYRRIDLIEIMENIWEKEVKCVH